jgi:hypothetical protein
MLESSASSWPPVKRAATASTVATQSMSTDYEGDGFADLQWELRSPEMVGLRRFPKASPMQVTARAANTRPHDDYDSDDASVFSFLTLMSCGSQDHSTDPESEPDASHSLSLYRLPNECYKHLLSSRLR